MTEAQGGFRSDRCLDQWLVLRGVCKLRKSEKNTSYFAFLDVSKAYDSVRREGLWCKMRHYGVEEKSVKVCEGLVSGVEKRAVMNGVKSRLFGVERCWNQTANMTQQQSTYKMEPGQRNNQHLKSP